MDEPLVNNNYQLEKFNGKGGWTYAAIPEILQDKHNHFGWVRVRGFIDNYELKNYHLMPMGNGCLFLPVKAEIRKKIGKQEGDFVRVVLFPDKLPVEISEELMMCFEEEPTLYKKFLSYSEGEKKAYIEWIYSAKKEETKVERIAKMFNRINRGQTLFE
jgi:hypothetical protein